MTIITAHIASTHYDCDFICQRRVIGSSKSAHRLPRDERTAEHPSHLQNDKAVIRLSTGYHHRVETLSRAERRRRLRVPMAPWDSIRASSLPAFFPLSLSLSLLRLISSDDDVIRPSHVTLNCSIISQLLSQPITSAVVPEAFVSTRNLRQTLMSGIFTDRARGSDRKIRATALFESFCNRQSCLRDITIQSLFPGYNLVSLLFINYHREL